MAVVNGPQQGRLGEVIQGMAKEAGFTITLKPSEFGSALDDNDAGRLRAFLVGWSGRVDPDGNIHQFHTCGGTLNTTNSCDEAIDALLYELTVSRITTPSMDLKTVAELSEKK